MQKKKVFNLFIIGGDLLAQRLELIEQRYQQSCFFIVRISLICLSSFVKWLTKIVEKLFDAFNRTAMAFYFLRQSMHHGIFDQEQFLLAPMSQAWSVSWRRDKVGAVQV